LTALTTTLFKRAKNDGIDEYVPKETISQETAAKVE
jgi:hypothetical protein